MRAVILLWLLLTLRPLRRTSEHPMWCDRTRCKTHPLDRFDRDGNRWVIHAAELLDDPGRLHVEVFGWDKTPERGSVVREGGRVVIEGKGLDDGLRPRDALRLAGAVTRAALMMAAGR